ncbi:Lrp/AsnC family transcriptional regulator, partial [Pseudomonas sp. PM2]|uniref:Lrp/AsnC family transcriptional regulator n=1 Tax=Pseudomonas sp. PM2 TaxID=215172 RepID=UPI003FA3208C
GVTRATVQTRLDRLLESGAVLGFTLRFRQDYDGSTIRAIMMIEVTGRSTTAVIKQLRGMPELHSLHTTNGTW